MAKLYFRWGTVGSSKTARMLMDIHNDRQNGKRVLVLKAKMDTRWDAAAVTSRVPGLTCQADALVATAADVDQALVECVPPPEFIYADEVQFFTREVVERLRHVATFSNIPVMCYGLRTTWKLELFEGSAALFALADDFQEVKSVCACWGEKCTRKTMVNVKHHDKKPVKDGPDVDLGAEDKYIGMCYQHHVEFTREQPLAALAKK